MNTAERNNTVYEESEMSVASSALDSALAQTKSAVYWLDSPDRPAPAPPLKEDTTADLVVVGGGYTGLWTALKAKERDPNRDVLLVEGRECGWAASGRNGGFISTSLTHGRANGERHLPEEVDQLDDMGFKNLQSIEETIGKYGIDCDFEWNGSITVAIESRHIAELEQAHSADPDNTTLFDQAQIRSEIKSPLYRGGLWHHHESALVDPARLVWGLRAACLEVGVRLYENTAVTGVRRTGEGSTERIVVSTGETSPEFAPASVHASGTPGADPQACRSANGVVVAKKVALATNAFRSLLPKTRFHTVPVYDYALMTEPLSDEQAEAIGWKGRQGLDDPDTRFHYYRITTDRKTGQPRILFGGYDAVYNFGRKISSDYDHRPETYRRLAAHFLATFPQLEGIRFTHQWGGAIDTCSRFFSFFDTDRSGRIAQAIGFTGLGVGASRFAAGVMLDLLSGEETALTRMEMVKKKPLPFPPEPLAWAGVQFTKREMVRSERNDGKKGLWLKLTDSLGMGFDS